MSDRPESERTEEATPRRREEAHNEGRIPRSQELTVAASLLGSAAVLALMTPFTARGMGELMRGGLSSIAAYSLDVRSATDLLRQTAWHGFVASLGIIIAIVCAPIGMAALQARGTFSLEPLVPKWSRIDPTENAKNLFGTRPLVELLKSLGKLAIVGLAVWIAIRQAIPDSITLAQTSRLSFALLAKKYAVRMLATAGGAYLALAVADYIWQWWQFEQSIRMTKDEVKQEHKQNDGDPQIKQRRRSIARSYARRQMMRDVPKADVVIVNPTHIAIAIKYDPAVAPAPIVLAIGRRLVAERIKAVASESGVPIVQNIPLARALVKTAKVGSLIPYELYMAVAEVLAFVFRTRGTRGSWQGSVLA